MEALTEQPRGHSFFVHYVVVGLVGSIIVAIGSLGVGWLPVNTSLYGNPVVEALRSPGVGVALARFCVIAGMALILQAWLVLGYDVLRGRVRELRALWWTLAAWCAPLLLTPPLFSRDAYAYYTQGKLLIQGLNPYDVGVAAESGWFNDGADPLWAESPTPYGPLYLLIERGVAEFVGPHPVWAAIAFRLWAVLAVAVLAVAVPVLAQRHGISAPKALWLAVLNPLVLMHFVAGAHNDALMAAAVVVGLLWAVDYHPIAGTLALALAISVKPIALIALPFIGLIWAGVNAGWWARIRCWIASGVIAGGVVIGLGLLSGTGLGWVAALSTPGAIRTWLSPPTAAGMLISAVVRAVGLGDHVDVLVTVFRAAAFLASVVILLWLVLRPAGRSAVRGAGLALLAVVVLGPVVQPWYLLWSLPLLAAAGLAGRSLHAVLLLTSVLTLHGVAGTSATSDALFEFGDGLGLLLVTGLLVLIVWASPRERVLLLGDPGDPGLVPEDRPSQARYDRMLIAR
ncbi:MAG TPA: polyprenol phosphomannose-dependent alpha 1,6 mannosyltransferase MptB [Actinomycetota bacterium]|nr:polyprenol phosphomannose-dependent alpha 1,6 mannosyltransferase MptB [Actinomycetota bacterium]